MMLLRSQILPNNVLDSLICRAENRCVSARAELRGWITSIDQIETIIGRPSPLVLMKQHDRLDEGSRRVLAHAPLAGFGFQDADTAHLRTTLIGGNPGFVRVESPGLVSLALPEGRYRPAPGSGVSFVFLMPGVGETLRLNGSVERSGTELRVAVAEVYVHCARCILRSGLWHHPESPPPVPEGPVPPDGGDGTGVLRDPRIAGFLAASPFLMISTWDAEGSSDTSPRGDQPGFVRLLDSRTLVIPDRKGNQRADTFHNVLADGRVSLAAVVPGRTDVLHLSGTAAATTDPALLSRLSLKGTAPHAALVVDVELAELADNEALSRAAVWRRASHIDRHAAPDLVVLATKHMATPTAQPPLGIPNGLLLKLLAAFPRLTRLMVDLGYRIQLRKEGYTDLPPGRRRHNKRRGREQ
jgi:predicted pyridoxine 5'-phosphate oxidase superfamily flavin-nucleotide-binding protein